jgi:phage terminase small subunit
MLEIPSKPLRSGRDVPKAPRHLDVIERRLWGRLVKEFDFADSASQAVLQTAMEAAMRARRCREQIDREGEAVKDRFAQIKPHPLLAAERDARAAFISAMRSLNLDLGSPK